MAHKVLQHYTYPQVRAVVIVDMVTFRYRLYRQLAILNVHTVAIAAQLFRFLR
jgi:hypothetical protein